jgi:hypothetical protein
MLHGNWNIKNYKNGLRKFKFSGPDSLFNLSYLASSLNKLYFTVNFKTVEMVRNWHIKPTLHALDKHNSCIKSPATCFGTLCHYQVVFITVEAVLSKLPFNTCAIVWQCCIHRTTSKTLTELQGRLPDDNQGVPQKIGGYFVQPMCIYPTHVRKVLCVDLHTVHGTHDIKIVCNWLQNIVNLLSRSEVIFVLLFRYF